MKQYRRNKIQGTRKKGGFNIQNFLLCSDYTALCLVTCILCLMPYLDYLRGHATN
jgi:hypothetical protein